jgi:hypothetical protein
MARKFLIPSKCSHIPSLKWEYRSADSTRLESAGSLAMRIEERLCVARQTEAVSGTKGQWKQEKYINSLEHFRI